MRRSDRTSLRPLLRMREAITAGARTELSQRAKDCDRANESHGRAVEDCAGAESQWREQIASGAADLAMTGLHAAWLLDCAERAAQSGRWLDFARSGRDAAGGALQIADASESATRTLLTREQRALRRAREDRQETEIVELWLRRPGR